PLRRPETDPPAPPQFHNHRTTSQRGRPLTHRAVTRTKPILDGPTRAMFDALETDPLAATHVGIVAPGGYGKSMLLAELEQVYRRAGLHVLTLREALTEHGDRSAAVLLVDDAHQLGEAQVVELCRLAETDRLRLGVAYRPWPRSAALSALTDVLGRTGPLLNLGPFDRGQVRDFLAG